MAASATALAPATGASPLKPVALAISARTPARALGAVIRGTQVLSQCAGAVGEAPCDADTMFSVASITKLVVATLVLQCRDRHELELDEDVRLRVPPECLVTHPRHPEIPITPRHLLTHVSGLRDDESALMPGPWRSAGNDCPVSLAAYVAARRSAPPGSAAALEWAAEAPGTARYSYSNFGFALLGLVVEAATGMPLPALARCRIFGPLGMERTAFLLAEVDTLPPDAAGRRPVVAVPHGPRGPLGLYGVAEYPAAALRSSLADILRFVSALAEDAAAAAAGTEASAERVAPPPPPLGSAQQSPSTPRLISPESAALMLPADFRKGLAWWGRDAQYGERGGGPVWERCWSHGGFMDGIRSHVHFWPDTGVAIVLLQNGEAEYKGAIDAVVAALHATGALPW
jgi:CubicO group peptidase (beta-lactamase class C family)